MRVNSIGNTSKHGERKRAHGLGGWVCFHRGKLGGEQQHKQTAGSGFYSVLHFFPPLVISCAAQEIMADCRAILYNMA